MTDLRLIYEKEILITEEFLDENQHVNNVQYVQWVEMIAAEHWELLKNKTQYATYVWFLVDHHIQYKKQVYLGDRIIVRTYPEKTNGIRQPRKVQFFKDDKLVVDSTTLWILIHPETEKIIRIDENWLDELID